VQTKADPHKVASLKHQQFLHALILDPPEALMGNSFTAYGCCGPCFSLSHSDLVHPYYDFCLLGPTDLLPEELGLIIKEFV
jgi:hypothetical protein